MKEKNQFTQQENFQLWAEQFRLSSYTYSVVVSSSDDYFRGYVNHPKIDYWDWFVVPSELIYHHTPQLIVKPRALKTPTLKKQPLLFCKRTIVPLRI